MPKKPLIKGDRVVAYGSSYTVRGTVGGLVGEGANIGVYCEDGQYKVVHPKQCRRLIKKKMRSLFFLPEALEHADNGPPSLGMSLRSTKSHESDIEFREVRKPNAGT